MPTRSFAVKFSPTRVDRDAGIIKGVSVITEGLANGEIVDGTTLRQIEACCKTYANGLKVVDRHTKGTDSIFSTVGMLRNFRIEGTKLLADLFMLRAEVNTPKLMEMAETIPDTFGLSVAFSGPDEVVNGKAYARCAEIYNAALVDVPAANPTGLFSDQSAEAATHFVDATGKATLKTMSQAQGDTGATTEPSLADRVKKLEDMCTAYEKKFAAIPDPAAASTVMAEMGKTVKELSEKLDTKTKELAEKFTTDEKRTELTAQAVAKEFAKHVGTTTVRTDGAGNAGDTRQTSAGDAAGSVAKFMELAKKHFAATKSKISALKLAMDEDPKAYAAFRSSGQTIKYS